MPPRPAGRSRFTAATIAAVTLVGTLTAPAQAAPQAPDRPNIVYVMLDDFSSDLLPYMSEVQLLADQGITFDNFFVTDSQCCPSRASTLTGMYPHNSGVLSNGWQLGGFDQFIRRHEDGSLSTQVANAGYRTGYIGKFLNGYRPHGARGNDGRGNDGRGGRLEYPAGYVPAGWDEWHVTGDGYAQFDYNVAEAIDADVADLVHYGHEERDYRTDVMSRTAVEFLDRAVRRDATAEPFFLTLAPFAVHARIRPGKLDGEPIFPPAPRDRAAPTDAAWPAGWGPRESETGDCGEIVGGCDAVVFPDPVDRQAFNQVPDGAPPWMGRGSLTKPAIAKLREMHLDRIRMAQSVNDLLRTLRTQLAERDLTDSTYIVFTSDNGYHLGQHGLRRGKNTMFDHDIRVPLIIAPPGGTEPRTVSAMAQNTDLLPTFLELAGGVATGADGRSLVPLLEGAAPSRWRQAALVEFTRGPQAHDPDRDSGLRTPTYRGVRTPDYIYVDYADRQDSPRRGEAEFYDLARDPRATVNRFGDLSRDQRATLDRAVDRYASCAGDACWAAGRSMPEVTTGRR